MNASRIVRNLIRVGQVNSVNASEGSIDVLFEDRDNLIVSNLPLLNFEYNIPSVGDQVLCVFLGNGLEQGFCLGGFYSDVSIPPVKNETIYRKNFGDGTYIQYDKNSGELQVTSQRPVKINGNVSIEGDITASGRVSGSNIGS